MQFWVWNDGEAKFISQEVTSLRLSSLMQAAGMALSGSDAARLIKSKSVSIRTYGGDWQKVLEASFQLPMGEPFYIKVGSGLWRLPQDPNAKGAKFVQLPGIRFVMSPMYLKLGRRPQSIDTLSEVWA